MCSDVMVIPVMSESDVAPIRVKPRQVSQSMWQIKCPRCGQTTNFRDSTWGGQAKCRNCGFKMNLPLSPNASQDGGCLGVALVFLAVALVGIARLA
jgi:predicted RNA-binding Zn-ribbon protein involved in translation (DUF1610 family)